MQIAPWVSYRNYQNFTIVIDHRSHLELELNLDGGLILDRLEDGATDFTPDEHDFIDQLKELDIVGENPTYLRSQTVSSDQFPEEDRDTSVFYALKAHAQEKRIPITGLFELTYRCPLQCQHCYLQGQELATNEEMSTEEIKNFLDQYKEMGGLYLTFTGGDPFVRKDFFEIYSYARKLRFAVTVMTCAYKLDLSLLQKMVEQGMYYFQVSIYGPNPEVHDSFTGVKGSFDNAINALKFAQSYNVEVRASLSIVKNNIAYYDEIVSMLDRDRIPYGINYIMNPRRNGDMTPVEMSISDEELLACIQKNCALGEPNLRNKELNDAVCDCGQTLLTLDPYGNLYPCMEMRQASYSVRDQKVADIWNTAEHFKKVRSYIVSDLIDCPDCEYKDFCNRCMANAIKDGKGVLDHSKWDCRYAKTLSQVINNG